MNTSPNTISNTVQLPNAIPQSSIVNNKIITTDDESLLRENMVSWSILKTLKDKLYQN
jgi:hypothetical protein